MAIHRLLKNRAFGPDEIKVLTAAYEQALRTLRLEHRTGPATEIIAKQIIEISWARAIRSDCVSARLNLWRNSEERLRSYGSGYDAPFDGPAFSFQLRKPWGRCSPQAWALWCSCFILNLWIPLPGADPDAWHFSF